MLAVSRTVSPCAIWDFFSSRSCTSSPRRLQAEAKEKRVRVEFYATSDLSEDEIDDLLSKLNNDWDGENDDCQAYSFNTTMFHPNVYYLQFQSF